MDPYVAVRADGLIVSGDRIYWSVGCGDDLSPATSSVGSSPVGIAQRLDNYDPGVCGPERVASRTVAADASRVFWLTGSGQVVSIPAGMPHVTPTGIAATRLMPSRGASSVIVVDGALYWSEANAVMTVSAEGGTTETLSLLSEPDPIIDLSLLSPGRLVVRAGQSLFAIGSGGAGPLQLLAEHVTGFCVGNGQLVWAATDPASPVATVSSQPVEGGAVTMLYRTDGSIDARRQTVIDSVAIDGSATYVHELHNVTGGPIVRLDSRGPQPISEYLPGGLRLVPGGGFLFWTDYNTGIFRLATGGEPAPPPGGIFITGIEVTQGVQTAAHTVSLIAGRRTLVRAYCIATEDAVGPWSGVTARLQVSGSARPHVPIQQYAITVPAGGSDRTTLTDSFLFELDPEEIRPGEVTITVQLVPPPGRATSTPAPEMQVSATFSAGAGGAYVDVGFYGVRYRYVNVPADQQAANGLSNSTWPERPWSTIADDARLAYAFLPVSALYVVQWPGNPVHEVEWADTYTAGQDWAHSLLDMRTSDDPVTRVAVLQPEITPMWQGTCHGTPPVCWINWHQQTPDDPGTTLAHELGHSLTLLHTENVGPEYGGTESSYPRYPDGTYGPEVGLAPVTSAYGASLDLPLVAVPGLNADGTSAISDLMSYANRSAHPTLWISPYCYVKAMKFASGGTIDDHGVDGFTG